jgi:NAD(P)-dependent dehydrogenase (short-subunit alcohol dehydrogenase family)
MEDAFQKIVSQLGVPHVLVNNAGMLASLERVVDMSLESWCSTQVSYGLGYVSHNQS